jgi:hypothetical protein
LKDQLEAERLNAQQDNHVLLITEEERNVRGQQSMMQV